VVAARVEQCLLYDIQILEIVDDASLMLPVPTILRSDAVGYILVALRHTGIALSSGNLAVKITVKFVFAAPQQSKQAMLL
jgi:hypothetical protein